VAEALQKLLVGVNIITPFEWRLSLYSQLPPGVQLATLSLGAGFYLRNVE
jgi:hypothetical protein